MSSTPVRLVSAAPSSASPASPAAPLRLSATTRLIADRAQTVTGVRGITWVTLDNDLRDTVLAPGQHTMVPANRLVVVTSLLRGGEFEVALTPAPGRAEAAGAGSWLASRFQAWRRRAVRLGGAPLPGACTGSAA